MKCDRFRCNLWNKSGLGIHQIFEVKYRRARAKRKKPKVELYTDVFRAQDKTVGHSLFFCCECLIIALEFDQTF